MGGEGKERNQDGFYVCSLGNGGCGAFTETGKMGVGAGYLEGSKPIQAVKAHKLPRWVTEGTDPSWSDPNPGHSLNPVSADVRDCAFSVQGPTDESQLEGVGAGRSIQWPSVPLEGQLSHGLDSA